MIPGTRIRLTDRCIWPERRGCTGVIVAPPTDGTYPQPSPSEVIVLLDADPLSATRSDGWTCCVNRRSVEAAS